MCGGVNGTNAIDPSATYAPHTAVGALKLVSDQPQLSNIYRKLYSLYKFVKYIIFPIPLLKINQMYELSLGHL
mgnify:CR=1 FL=1